MRYLLLCGLVLILVGCGSEQPDNQGRGNTAPSNQNQATHVPGNAQQGNAEHGRELFNTNLVGAACATCHRTDSEEKLVGPGLKNVSARVSTYQLPQPEATDDYLRTSILTPNAFVVPGYPSSVMPPNFGQVLTPQDINDLIAYLRTL